MKNGQIFVLRLHLGTNWMFEHKVPRGKL